MRILQRIGILVCLFPTLSAFGQETDSLRTLLTKAPPDTARVSLLAETSIAYQAVNGDSSLIFAEEGIALATKLKFAYGHARCLFCKGVAYDIKGETEKAIAIITAAREEFRQIGDSTGVAATTQSMGVAWFYGGDQNKSLAAYTEALSMFERLGQDKNVSRTLNNIAIIYRNQQKYEQAIEIYNKAIRVKEKLNDLDGIAATHMNLGIAYSYLKDEEKAESFIRKAMVHYSATGNLRELNSCKAALGVSLLNQKKYAEAETMLEASMGQDLDPQLLPIHLLSLAKAEIPMKKFGEAAVHAREALMALGNEENMEMRKQITLEIAVAEAGLGQFESAYRSMLAYDSLSTVVLSADRMKEIELLEKKFETKEKDKDLEIAKLRNEQLESSKRLLYAAVALAVLLLMAAVYFVWSKSRHNRNLAEKNVLIEKALAEKEILLREIHHRVKNNLQVVSSLLSIQSREIEDEKAQEAITESRNRVRSMALIHQNLYSDDYLTGIDMQDYVTKLSSSLFNTYKTDHDQVELRSDVAPMVLDVDTTIPLGLILNELITNALKYAFVGVTQGILSVYLKEENGQLVLRVSDNGVGMSEGSGRTDSFGLKMIKSFASKLEATWEIRNQGGMTVELRISKYRKAA